MSHGKTSVLVIDDEPGIREMLSYELSQEGYDVTTVENGMAAVAAVQGRKFDLAITDLKMPGMDGVATLAAIKQVDPDLQVIIATGYATVDTAVNCMKRGAFDYIQKPYDLTELQLILTRALEASRLQGVVALYDVSRILLETLNYAELPDLVIQMAAKVMRADSAMLYLADATRPTVAHGPITGSDGLVNALIAMAQATGGPLRVGAGTGQQAMPPEAVDSPYQAALVYPLAARGRHVGSLVLLRDATPQAFSMVELQRGTVFATQIALALDNARLYSDLAATVGTLTAPGHRQVDPAVSPLALRGDDEATDPTTAMLVKIDDLRDYSTQLGAWWLAAKGAAEFLRSREDWRVAAGALTPNEAESRGDSHDRDLQAITEIIDDNLDGLRRVADLLGGFGRLAGRPERPSVATSQGA